MALTKYYIGRFVETYIEFCGVSDLSTDDVSGVNRDKEFFEPSKQVGTDTSKYKVVPPNYFACNLMHVGRDVVLPVALNHTNHSKIVSPAYTVFKVIDNEELLRDYFFIMLKSSERDRYFWFHTDSSVRDGMSWEDFCNLEIELPPLPIQQKYVNVYNAMLANQRVYESGLEDLNAAISASVEEFKHSAPHVAVGTLLEDIDVRNIDGSITNVQGVNINKTFMPSVANLSSVNLTRYKVIKKNQFAANFMHVMRDGKIPIALYQEDEPCIISPAYPVFKVRSKHVLAEYIILCINRQESDRYAWFISDSSVRGGLELSRFFEIEIPLPPIDVQQYIVNIYTVYQLRREINEQLKAQIKDLCPIIIKGSIKYATDA